jgi:hypothetical protein
MALNSQLDQIIHAMLPVLKQFHSKGQLAPHAASLNLAGDLKGASLVVTGNQSVSVSEALVHFESQFREAATAGQIVASAIFFHGVGLTRIGTPASTIGEASALVGMLEHKAGDSVYLIIPYHFTDSGIEYALGKLIAKPASVFQRE